MLLTQSSIGSIDVGRLSKKTGVWVFGVQGQMS